MYRAFLICTCRLPQPNNQSHRAYSLAPFASCRFCQFVLIAIAHHPLFLKREGSFLSPSLHCYSLRNGLATMRPIVQKAFLNITFRDALPGSPSRYVRMNLAHSLSHASPADLCAFMLSSLPSLLCSSCLRLYLPPAACSLPCSLSCLRPLPL